MISCVELFCGIGGLTHGLERGGISVAAGIDLDPACKFPYEANNKAAFVECNVCEIQLNDLLEIWQGAELRLLAGCAPCQPFSTYGRKFQKELRSRSSGPTSDTRWALVEQFGRLVRQSSPELVTMENVPQLVDHAIFENFLRSLRGYHIWHQVVDCVEFGVPQTRKRLVLLASKLGPIELRSFKKRKTIATVRNAIGHLPPIAAGEPNSRDRMHVASALSELNLRRIRSSRPGGTWREWDKSLLSKCHTKESGQTFPSVYGRMEWEKPAPTMTTQCFGYGNGRFGHPEQDRAISLREAAILQTFPAKYKFVPSDKRVVFQVVGRLIGNAVPVKLGEAIAKSLVAHVAKHGVSR